MMLIEYHPAKNEANLQLRNLSFERVAEFDFESARILQDTRHTYPEVRFVATGFLDARLHVLCFTSIAGGIRVISFRKANPREVKVYEQTV